jgi:hypothetical protein
LTGYSQKVRMTSTRGGMWIIAKDFELF